MIEPVEAVFTTHVTNQSLKTPTHPKQQSTITDITQISQEAHAALNEAAEPHHEVTIKAKCGDLEAQRLLEQEAARKELLGI